MKSTPSLNNEPRIELLDGFRCIAVMSVVLYHYYYWFAGVGGFEDFPSWSLLKYGFFGVHLFFMISGFVIYRSMEQSFSVKEFLGKRYLRLVPALALCSIVTYAMIEWWNDSDRLLMFAQRTPLDFLFSFTLIHPEIWNSVLGTSNIKYIDGAYWSLWPEIIFYVSSSIVFFNSRKENFLRNWFVLVLFLNILRVATSPKLAAFTPEFFLPISNAYYRAFLIMNISQWPYFSIGILFYSLWMKRRPSRMVWSIVSIIFLLEMYFIPDDTLRILFVAAIGLWIVFFLRPQSLHLLQWRPIQLIGLISYPLYLLHETGGLVLAEKLIIWTNHSVPIELLLVIVFGVFILLSYLIFRFYEKPVTRALKRKLLGIK